MAGARRPRRPATAGAHRLRPPPARVHATRRAARGSAATRRPLAAPCPQARRRRVPGRGAGAGCRG
eukprot:5259297-Prymnesium_polylepis.1